MDDDPQDPTSPMLEDSPHTHAFVVKIWLEEAPGPQFSPLWRGHITDAYSGERRYFQDLDVILDFIHTVLDKSLGQAGD